MPKDSPSVVMLSPDVLVPHPLNPRGKVTKDDVKDLVPVIEVHGQKQPCLVRPLGGGAGASKDAVGKYEILIGHRRAMVGEVLGRSVPCIVATLSDDEALAIMLADNPSHVAPDPLRESEAVAAFLARDGWTLQSVAEALGKSPRWVAQRANLQNLSARVRPLLKVEDCPLSKWPVAWLERLATVSAEDQERFVGELSPKASRWSWSTIEDVTEINHIDEMLAQYTNKLSKAPWNLNDGTLVPEAGPCFTCPKQSGCKPGLFDDGTAVAGDPKKDVCLDGACWKKKLKAHVDRKGADLLAKHPDLVAVEGDFSYGASNEALPTPKGVKKLPHWATKEAKKGEKGALPAFVVKGKGRGTLKYVKLTPAWTKQAKAKEAKKRGEPVTESKENLKEQAEQLAKRRAERAVELFKVHVRAMPCPFLPGEPEVLVRMAVGLGVSAAIDDWAPTKAFEEFLDKRVPMETGMVDLWGGVAETIASCYYRPGDDFLPYIAAYLKVDLAQFEAAALKEIPDPKPVGEITQKTGKGKGWSFKKEQEKAAKRNRKSGAAKKGEASAVKKCRQCGCTEASPCPGGCAWYVRETDGQVTDICTACAVKNVGEGKKAEAASAAV